METPRRPTDGLEEVPPQQLQIAQEEIDCKCYKLSGEYPMSGVVLSLMVGSACAVLASFPYSYLAVYVPYVYFAVPFMFGGFVGAAASFGAKLGKVRDVPVVKWAGYASGVVAVYAAWVVWILAFSKHQLLVIDPLKILKVMQQVAAEGSWSVAGITPKGLVLYVLWLVEAAIVVGMGGVFAGFCHRSRVFCEGCSTWVTCEDQVSPLEPEVVFEALYQAVKEADFSYLEELTRAKSQSEDHVKLEIQSCPSCRKEAYLTAKAVFFYPQEKGEPQKVEKEFVERLIIPAQTHQRLLEMGTKPS